MKRLTLLIVCAALAFAATAEAQNKVLYDSKGFEGPLYSLGVLPGQDGWVDDTFSPAGYPVNPQPAILADPTGSGMGQVVEFNPVGNGYPSGGPGWSGAYRANDAGPSTGSLVIIEWDQYRDDFPAGAAAPDGDNFWYADNIAWDGWWGMQWDQNLMASSQSFNFGMPVEGKTWQHVRYLFNFISNEVIVEVDGTRFIDASAFTEIDGIDFEVEPTPPGDADDEAVYVDNVKISEVSLMTDENEIPETVGGQAYLYLDAGSAYAGRTYLMLGNVTGTSPGTPLPGGKILPLNWDVFTNTVINLLNTAVFFDFFGQLDGNGQAVAIFTAGPVTGATGLEINFAYTMFKPYDFVSNPVSVTIVP